MTASVLAVDVGGTTIKAARFDAAFHPAAPRTVPTPVGGGPDAVVVAIRALVRSLLTPDVGAVGVVVPGAVDEATGTVGYAANLGWRDVPLGAVLQADTGRPVVIEHDAHGAGLAECSLGAAHGVTDSLVAIIGTGISAFATTGGQSVRGAFGLAGEIGHFTVHPDGEACRCGNRGCTEVYASAAGIARRYVAATGRSRTAAEIAASLPTDPAARDVWDAATDALGIALANCTMLLDPSLFVIGGGLAGAGAALRDPVAKALAARLPWRAAPDLEISPLAGCGSLVGAALFARRLLDGSLS